MNESNESTDSYVDSRAAGSSWKREMVSRSMIRRCIGWSNGSTKR